MPADPKATLNSSLPYGEAPAALEFPHFPVPFQAVIWRNWGLVPTEHLAAILDTSQEYICRAADLLGLPPHPEVNPLWLTRGYMTLFRKNWHLLSYDQFAEMLGWDVEKFLFHFKEDDVIWHKLGDSKPTRPRITWRELTADEAQATRHLRDRIRHHFKNPPKFNAFDFFQEFETPTTERPLAVAVAPPLLTECPLGGDLWFDCQEPADPLLTGFIARYTAKWQSQWWCQIRDTPGATRIRVFLEPNENLKPESHSLRVSPEEIVIKAVDVRGVLRALQFLDREMLNGNRPFVRLGDYDRETVFDLRLIYPYHVLFGDPLFADDSLPEGLLARYSDLGINGVWLHAALPTLFSWSVMPEISDAWCEKRLNNLAQMVAQAARYGIEIFLYFNEPRALPIAQFENRRDLLGIELDLRGDRMGTLCTSHPVVQAYLEDAMEALFRRVPALGGILTITMSENPTNCYSSNAGSGRDCPRCGTRDPGEVVAEVNTLLFRGVKRASPSARCIAWSWGWRHLLEETKNVNLKSTLKELPADCYFMAASEDGLIAEVAGREGRPVLDYSISQVGPSAWSKRMWTTARSIGLKTAAKLQINNSWELSAVPMLPVLNHIHRHLENLSNHFPDCVMLSWSLGGYPSETLRFIQNYYWRDDSHTSPEQRLDAGIRNAYGDSSLTALKGAFDHFSRGFSQFPYDLCVAYYGPQNYGPMNLLFEEKFSLRATMVGFPYNDLDSWKYPFTEHVFERQFAKLCRSWKAGLDELDALTQSDTVRSNGCLQTLSRNAHAAYCHFETTLQQIRFIRRRNKLLEWGGGSRENQQHHIRKILQCLQSEIATAKRLEALVAVDSTIGFEGSNHYYYTWHDLREKVLNCEHLISLYQCG